MLHIYIRTSAVINEVGTIVPNSINQNYNNEVRYKMSYGFWLGNNWFGLSIPIFGLFMNFSPTLFMGVGNDGFGLLLLT